MFNLYDPDFNFDSESANWIVEDTEMLIDRMNCVRSEAGMTDLVSADVYNEVWYDFYAVYDKLKNEVVLMGVCNYGEKDDYKNYEIPLTSVEREELLKLVIKLYDEETKNYDEEIAEENDND